MATNEVKGVMIPLAGVMVGVSDLPPPALSNLLLAFSAFAPESDRGTDAVVILSSEVPPGGVLFSLWLVPFLRAMRL